METTVNSRILLLKKDLGLTDIQFCGRAQISTATLNKIKNNEEITQKIVFAVLNTFNVNKDWLMTGKGKMFADVPKEVQSIAEPWRDALVMQVKEENSRLIEQVRWLQQMVSQFTNGVKPNFLKVSEYAYSKMFFPNEKTFITGSDTNVH